MEYYLRTRDYAVSGETFDLVAHERWKMLVTKPQPAQLQKYYDSPEYISHSDDTGGLVNTLYQIARSWTIRRKIRGIAKFLPEGGSVLDIGAGTADFLLAATEKGWHTAGVEPNETARAKALTKGVKLKSELAEITECFHVITLWHVLEHLPDLERSIDQILSCLLPGGTLVLAVPNYCSWDARHYGKYWAAYDVPRHLWHFSQQAVQSIFEERGFKVVHTQPMWLDAFYIALLSEKYRGSSFSLFKALYKGSRSNLTALRTGEFSSLTYVLQRA
jgi:2-polyprenyl-3-methyl-5-hydroxy-6-metoxy-1,4-benzoquinol methylase